ncbi:MAG: glycosyltransferase [Acutalibacteraceae bacterium]
MSNVDISVIIPSKNNKNKTAEIIRKISEQTGNIEVEFIVIDMNSTDNTVLLTLNEIKNNNLRGCVIQSGGGTVSSALNTGIFKSDGKYITFVYPRRLYKNYISDYYNDIESQSADFVFSMPSETKSSSELVRAGLNNISGTDLAIGLVRSIVNVDFTAVMFKREFLLSNHIRFYEECNYGYAEAFIFNALLYNPKVAYSDIVLERDYVNGLSKEDSTALTNNCFERVDSILKVAETVRLRHKNNEALNSAFEYQKIPSVVMSCVDILLNAGFGYNAIKNSLHLKHYDNLLKVSKSTPLKLRKQIFKWKATPWLYKPTNNIL